MAGLKSSIAFEDVATAGSATWKTIASVKAPTNQMLRLLRVKICGEGIAGDAKPLGVRLARVTAASGTATTGTMVKLNNALSATVQAVGRTNFTVEPSLDGTTPYLYSGKFHPQGGQVDDLAFEDCYLKEATELALQVYTPSGGSAINVSGHIEVEE